MLDGFRRLSRQVLARLSPAVPNCCALCGDSGEEALCDGCHRQFFTRRLHRCAQCAAPLPEITTSAAILCGQCLKHPPAFDATIAAADYAPPVDQLVLALKFGNRLALAPLFARMLRDAVPRGPWFALPMLLTAVPLGSQRLMERGYNQALEIARPMSRALGIPLDPALLVRMRDTEAQAMLHPDERRKNIRNAFVVPDHAIDKVRGRHIGVVDDVITTGETLNELAATLKRFGATRVTNFVFARTPQK
jgi:ComF family protein